MTRLILSVPLKRRVQFYKRHVQVNSAVHKFRRFWLDFLTGFLVSQRVEASS
jgi:hypothetical protein